MNDSSAIPEKMYTAYLEFLEVAERKRRWNIFDDVPWNRPDPSLNREHKATRIETYCAEEFYLPDYIAGGVELSRPIFGAAWFQGCWSYEESKHGLVFREYLTRSGMRSASQLAQFEDSVFAANGSCRLRPDGKWLAMARCRKPRPFFQSTERPYHPRGRRGARSDSHAGQPREAAHASFYRTMARIELEADRAGTIADLTLVVPGFKMPGDGLIPHYRQRLRDSARASLLFSAPGATGIQECRGFGRQSRGPDRHT
jgi:acyl-[acyl-carrier-protein] desaturase